MTQMLFDLTVSSVSLAVMLALLMITSNAPRHLRVGITAATSVVLAGVSARLLDVVGQPVAAGEILEFIASLKVLALSWAALDVARIAMRIGTLDPVIAANTARGFLMSAPVIRSVWGAWAASCPVPAWLKSGNGQMLAVNASYEARYGKAEHAYVGEMDADVWGDTESQHFAEHDAIVAKTMKPAVFEEPAPTWKNPTRSSRFLKFPVLDTHGRLVAIGGMEIADAEGSEPLKRWDDTNHPRRRRSDRT